jgi:hypothetical protein
MLEKSLETCKEFIKETIKMFKAINKYNRIDTGNIQKGKSQMVFACLYTKNAAPYKQYPHIPEQDRNKTIPLVLMQVRWDGRLGFPGGEAEPGENLLVAIQRELGEELDLDLEKLNDSQRTFMESSFFNFLF